MTVGVVLNRQMGRWIRDPRSERHVGVTRPGSHTSPGVPFRAVLPPEL
jgi:hypothetical protein